MLTNQCQHCNKNSKMDCLKCSLFQSRRLTIIRYGILKDLIYVSQIEGIKGYIVKKEHYKTLAAVRKDYGTIQKFETKNFGLCIIDSFNQI